MTDHPKITIEGEEYDSFSILVQKRALADEISYRRQNVSDFFKLFNTFVETMPELDGAMVMRLSRLTGTSLLEAAFLLRSLYRVSELEGDWCEYGVATGRTSALLAQVMLRNLRNRSLWLYDSFQGLPAPSGKDILLDDIYGEGSIEAYAGYFSYSDEHVRRELASVSNDDSHFRIVKGWITPELLHLNSPERVSFAYLDMDFYQSTYDVLELLVGHLVRGGVAIIDDYGVFSSGVRTAVTEIIVKFGEIFSFERPFNDKFVIVTRK